MGVIVETGSMKPRFFPRVWWCACWAVPLLHAQEALPEGNTGIAAGFPGDAGISGAVLFHDDFEKGEPKAAWDMVHHEAHIRMATEPENVNGGGRSLEFTVPQGDKELSNSVVKTLGEGHDVVFLRYYSKFETGFDQTGSSHNGGSLTAVAPGAPLATPGIQADGKNKFGASFENWRENAETASPGGLNVYCYHPGQRTPFGDHFFPSGMVLPFSFKPGDFGPSFVKRPDLIQDLGRWYCHELMVRANAPGQTDGRIACWLDGKLIADFPGLRLRDVAGLKINHASLDLHIGRNPARANRKWYDDVVVATSYIGPKTPVKGPGSPPPR